MAYYLYYNKLSNKAEVKVVQIKAVRVQLQHSNHHKVHQYSEKVAEW
jgi:hypothetical protein